MCGLVGSLSLDARSVDPDAIRAASVAIAHRGPDDHGYLGWAPGRDAETTRDPGRLRGCSLLVAHRRLSILDLSDSGAQPMGTPDGQHHIAFNGEIYNYLELGHELASEGVSLSSHSDTEVLLQGLARHGVAWLPRLVGMFAFAYVDLLRRRLLLARDPFGIKPLYVATTSRALHFGSEVKALLEFPDVRRVADVRGVFQYLAHGAIDHRDECLLEGIRRVPAGHALELDLARPLPEKRSRFWSLRVEPARTVGAAEAASTFRRMFLESVDLHLRSDVPVAAALSGGIDSTSIVMAVRELRGEALDLHTFSHISSDPATSEEPWVDIANRRARTTVHKSRPTAGDFARDLETYIRSNDEPFGWCNGYAQFRVFRAIHEMGIKVSLDGQGADEMLCGYDFFVRLRLEDLLRQGRLAEAWRLALASENRGVKAGLHQLLRRAAASLLPPTLARRLARRGATQPADGLPLDYEWLSGRLAPDPSGRPPRASRDSVREALRDSFCVSSLPRLLRCEDRNSMAHSVESRVPFLTPELVEFAFSLPTELLISVRGIRKPVLGSAMRGIVPAEILDRRDKVAFGAPNWLSANEGAIRAILGSDHAKGIPLLRHEGLTPFLERTIRGPVSEARGLWRVVNLVLWARAYDVRFP